MTGNFCTIGRLIMTNPSLSRPIFADFNDLFGDAPIVE